MASIQDAYNRLYALCEMENPYCLYTLNVDASQGPTRFGYEDSAGNLYFDCSSIISYCLWYAGILETNPWFSTFTMADYLTEANGFTTFDPLSEAWQNGDIMVRHGDNNEHTEMVYDASGYITMGAHSSNRAQADQVSVRDYASPTEWQIGYRYTEGWIPTPETKWTPDNYPDEWTWFTDWPWHTNPGGPGYTLGTTESMDNARNIFTYCWQVGWKRYAICALLGNMQAESGLNPGRHEDGGDGFGLVQWTPASVLEAAMQTIFGEVTDDMLNGGHHQMLVLLGEYMTANYIDNGYDWSMWGMNVGIEKQWYASTGAAYGFELEPVTWYEWATTDMLQTEETDENALNDLLETLTLQFMVDYLRPSYDPADNHWDIRVQFARNWYNQLADFVPPRPYTGFTNTHMPLWLLAICTRRRIRIVEY